MTWRAYDLGMLALQRGERDAARAHFEAAGDDAAALLRLGRLVRGDDPARALALYERAAELGDAAAAYDAGAMHAAEPADLPAALRCYQRAADLGDIGALRMTGMMYATGQGVPVDEDEAEARLLPAAEAGEQRAFHDLGILYAYHKIDLPKAGLWFLRAGADRELALLAPRLSPGTILGVIKAYHLGEQRAGAEMLEAPAAAGDPMAQRSLAFLLQHGHGVPADETRAVELYRAAAEGGDEFAAFNMGLLSGADPAAVRWFRIAADGGVTDACTHLGNLLGAQDLDEEALSWYVRGAEAGIQGCMFAAACWYRDGFGGPVDLVRALRWYLSMLDTGSGDGVHEAHRIVPAMTVDEIHEAGRLSGRYLEADLLAAKAPARRCQAQTGTAR
ncbi:tetratricopeptide repeat protein [Actinoplanes sp. NPDC049802]|uniref:tetratricopeptide repeat protein n=1 Tax=Actinoplanes sp. NPDC049802 TaxID=3154742 RepID=UPI0033C11D35